MRVPVGGRLREVWRSSVTQALFTVVWVGALMGCGSEATDVDVAPPEAGPSDGVVGELAPDTATDVARDGVTDADRDVEVGPDPTDGSVEPTPAAWHETAVFYEIFVRSFQDSDGDGIGDFQGLISRLDYLNDGVEGEGDDLEIDALWLMPVFPSPSYHGYDVTDYRAINPEYGSEADFDAFLAAAEARGIRVVLDLVINHSSSQHQWFVNAKSGPEAAFRDFYLWRDEDPGWKRPFGGGGSVWHPASGQYYFALFWEGMPDLNYRNPAVHDEMVSVAGAWLDRGVAGFRIDAARYLVEGEGGEIWTQPETLAFFKDFRAALAVEHPEHYLVGEVWTGRGEVSTHYVDVDGEGIHQAFDFDLMGALESAAEQSSPQAIASELSRQASAGTPWAFAATFANNHDLERLSFRLDDAEQRMVAAMLLLLPGTPYIYYGDELGMKMGLLAGDPAKRTPMAWDGTEGGGFTTGTPWAKLAPESDTTRNVAAQLADEGSLLNLHRALIRLRKAHPVLATGDVTVIPAGAPELLVLLRAGGDEVALALVNLGGSDVQPGAVDLSAYGDLFGEGPWNLQPWFADGQDLAPTAATNLTQIPLGPEMAAGGIRVLGIASQ